MRAICLTASFSAVKETLTRLYGQQADARIDFCAERMDVLSRYPDRVMSLASVLDFSRSKADPDLIGWAIVQLVAMDTPPADRALKSVAAAIEAMPPEAEARIYRDNILQWQRRRSAMKLTPPSANLQK